MAGLLRFPNINKVTISGRMVRDVEVRHSASNVPRAVMCIAVSKYFKDEYGNYQEQASFVDLVAYGKTVQICQESLKKGSPLLVEGELRTRTYTDQNNANRKVTEIIVDRIYPLERDENYVPNHSNQNMNTGYSNQPFPQQQTNQPPPIQQQYQQQNVPHAEPESFPPYPSDYADVGTENDVPF